MWTWCRMEKISWTEHISNEEVLDSTTGRRRKIHVNDNKNDTTELDGTYTCNERGLTSKIIIEGIRMEGKK